MLPGFQNHWIRFIDAACSIIHSKSNDKYIYFEDIHFEILIQLLLDRYNLINLVC